MTDKNRCIIYARVSSKTQATADKSSLDTQLAECRKACVERGYEIVAEFEDTVPRSTLDRPGLNEARRLIREGKADVLMAMVVDRLSGDQQNLYILMHEVESHGARLEFAREVFEKTAIGGFLLSVKSFTAELELERNSTRIKDGNHAKKVKGEHLGALPLGYIKDKDDKTRVVEDDRTAPTVRRIFHLYADELLSLGKVGKILKAEGHTTAKGKKSKWSATTLGRIIKNDRYMGRWPANQWKEVRERGKKPRRELKPTSEWIWHDGPDLVAPDLWHKANRILATARQSSPRRAKQPENFLLQADQLRCGICKRKLYGYTPPEAESKHGRSPYYQCARKGGGAEECRGAYISTKGLDPPVWDIIHELLEDPDRLVEWGMAQAEDGSLDVVIAQTVAELKTIKEDHDTATSRWLDAPDSALPKLREHIDGLATRIAVVEQKLVDLETQRDHLASMEGTLDSWLTDARERLDDLTHKEKQQIIRDLGVRVTVYPEGAEHRWLLSMDPEVLLIGPEALEPGWYEALERWNGQGGPFQRSIVSRRDGAPRSQPASSEGKAEVYVLYQCPIRVSTSHSLFGTCMHPNVHSKFPNRDRIWPRFASMPLFEVPRGLCGMPEL